MSRLILAVVTGVLFVTGAVKNVEPSRVPLRQTFIVVPKGTEVIGTITESASGRIQATVIEDVIIDDAVAIHKGSHLSGQIFENRTEFTLLNDQPVFIVPSAAVAVKSEDPTLIASSILIGAIVGNQINMKRPEIGALMGGISGLAVAADRNSETILAVGDLVPLLIQRDLTVRL